MNKKGFTLAELLAVIAVIGFISLLLIPKAFELIDQSKNKAYERETGLIENAAKQYFVKNSYDVTFDANGVADVMLSEIINSGLINSVVNNPKTGESFDLSATGANVRITKTGEKYSYRFYENLMPITTSEDCFFFNAGSQTITGYDTACSANVIMPAEINGVRVLHIADEAFIMSSTLALTGIDLSNAIYLETIGYRAFYVDGGYYTSSVTSLNLNNLTNLITINEDAFANLALTGTLDLSDSINLVTIGNYSFGGNYYGTVTLPTGNLETIDDYAFEDNQIVSRDIPNTVTYIGESAFESNSLTSLSLTGALITVGDYAFSDNFIATLQLPNSLEVIGEHAFSHNLLTSITIPASVEEIRWRAFSNNMITTINMPMADIGFDGATFVDNQMAPANAFRYFKNPDGSDDLTTLESYAGALRTGVSVPAAVTNIYNGAFTDSSITSVTIPSGVTNIGGSAFSYNNMPSVSIPNTVLTIGEYAFNSSGLTSITIPNSVTTAGGGAFADNNITTATIGTGISTLSWSLFENNSISSITIPSNVTNIGSFTFEQNNLTTVVIPNSVTSIGDSAFAANSLTQVTIGTGITNIESRVFIGNVLTRMIINKTGATVGNNILSYNSNHFITAYYLGGAGTYNGTQEGIWTKA